MKAQIKAINTTTKTFNNRNFDGMEVTYQPEPYQGKEKPPVTRFIFGNSEAIPSLKTCNPGDWVNIEFTEVLKNGRTFKNPVSFTKTTAPVGNTPNQPVSGSTSYQSSSDARQESIEKQCCLKEAVNLVAALAANGGYTAANVKKREFMTEEVKEIAKEFYSFLSGSDEVDEVDFNQDATDNDFDQDTSNDQ